MIRIIVIFVLLAALLVYSYALIGYGQKKYEYQVPRYGDRSKIIEEDCDVNTGEPKSKCYRIYYWTY